MFSKTLLPFLSIVVISCNANVPATDADTGSRKKQATTESDNPYTIIASIPLPDGYKRIPSDSNSFATWLGNISLKKNKVVYLFTGDKKENQDAQFAVLDISIGNKDLQQCADAIMRLRAEYLFDTKQFSTISFADNENTTYQFSLPYTKQHLHDYLQRVFGMCGSASLSKQLHKKGINDIMPGDVFIRGGFPGHAEIVIDVAVNDTTGKKIFLLAQSYMPAQDIHILVNPLNKNLSPWYEIEDDIITPEYAFDKNELKTW
ncbi:MAG: DUF4846 domain-containing protein [Bacteroidota bacterium]